MSMISQFMGSAAPVTTILTSNDTIQLGDLVALASDGNAYACNDPTVGGLTSFSKPLYAAASTGVISLTAPIPLFSPSATGPGGQNTQPFQGSPNQNVNACTLTGGNVAVVAEQVGGGQTIVVTILSPTGVPQYPPATVATTSSTLQPSIVALSNGGFAVVYANNSAYTTFAIYDATCTQTVAPTVVDSSHANTAAIGPQAIALTGGGFVMGWGATSLPYYAIFSNTGTATLNSTSFANGGANQAPGMAALSGGGFVLCCYGSATVARTYTATGTVVTANTGLAAVGTNTQVIVLSGGGFAFFGSGGGLFTVVVTNSTLVQQGSTVTAGNNTLSYAQYAGVALSNGNGQFIWGTFPSSSYTQCAIYSTQVTAAGALVSTVKLAINCNPDVAIQTTTDGGFVVHYSQTTTAYLQKMTAGNATTNSPLPTASATGSGNSTIYTNNVTLIPVASGGIVRVIGSGTIGTGLLGATFEEFYGSAVLARVFLGVALNNASATQAVTIQMTGWVQTRLTFAQSYSCDFRALSPPGQQAFFAGNSVKLNGLI